MPVSIHTISNKYKRFRLRWNHLKDKLQNPTSSRSFNTTGPGKLLKTLRSEGQAYHRPVFSSPSNNNSNAYIAISILEEEILRIKTEEKIHTDLVEQRKSLVLVLKDNINYFEECTHEEPSLLSCFLASFGWHHSSKRTIKGSNLIGPELDRYGYYGKMSDLDLIPQTKVLTDFPLNTPEPAQTDLELESEEEFRELSSSITDLDCLRKSSFIRLNKKCGRSFKTLSRKLTKLTNKNSI